MLEESVIEQSDSLVYCRSCGLWDAFMSEKAPTNCGRCASPTLSIGSHKMWGRNYNRAAGYVSLPMRWEHIAIMPETPVANVLKAIKKKYGQL